GKLRRDNKSKAPRAPRRRAEPSWGSWPAATPAAPAPSTTAFRALLEMALAGRGGGTDNGGRRLLVRPYLHALHRVMDAGQQESHGRYRINDIERHAGNRVHAAQLIHRPHVARRRS